VLTQAYHAAGARVTVFCVAAALAAGAAGGPASAEALRIVSLTPVGTSILLALGERDRLVAVDAASASLPGLAALPVADLATAAQYAPGVLIVPAADAEAARRAAPAANVVDASPHDFDEAWSVFVFVGAVLGREAEARRFVRETSRPLAELGAAAFGKRRPKVAAVLALDPLEVAGGHSFATDLIELAGGESATHGTEEPRLAWSQETLAGAQPELVVVVVPQEPSAETRTRARGLVGAAVPLEFLVFEGERDWLGGALPAARRLQGWVDAARASR
jgi:ABC-type hemin transport system substrate-binding protein